MQFDDSDVLVSDMVDRLLDGGIVIDSKIIEGIDLSDHKSFFVVADLEVSLPYVRSWNGR
jgi:hypothetical protein